MTSQGLSTVSAVPLAVVLVEPRIPQNVGNIGRLCACTGANLVLVGDLGFSMDTRDVRRSGMDYLEHLTPQRFADFPEVVSAYSGWDVAFLSSKAQKLYTQIEPPKTGLLLVFGSETQGLPEAVLTKYPQQCYRIPMIEGRRSLNLSTSAGIVVYDVLRQAHQWPRCPS